MSTTPKKLLSLALALMLALQWAPALAARSSVTWNGDSADVTADDMEDIYASSWKNYHYNDQDAYMRDDGVYIWDDELQEWVLVEDPDQALLRETHSVSVRFGPDYADLNDGVSEEHLPSSIAVRTENVSSRYSDEDTNGYRIGISAQPGVNGIPFSISAGNVDVVSPNSALGIELMGESATVNVSGYVHTDGTNNTRAVYAGANKDATQTVTVDGEVNATSEKGFAQGVIAFSKEGQASVTTGSVTARGGHGGSGVSATAGSTDYDSETETIIEHSGKTDMTVNGDVSAIGSDLAVYWVDTTGVSASSQKDSENTVTVTGSVSAVKTGNNGSAHGLNMSGGKGSTTTVTVGKDVSANASQYQATGVSVSGNGQFTAEIGGNVTASGASSATGMNAWATANGGDVTLNAKDVSATATQGGAKGATIRSFDGNLSLTLGNLSAEGKTGHSQGLNIQSGRQRR
ncbi:MAG: hypothetical protein IJS41_09335 [Clostridia bacterium]|nr:hypothetical protein [Clostridia bacterium]